MKIVDLIEAVKGTSDIDKKFEHVVISLSTASIANTNALLTLLDVLDKSPGLDKELLKDKLQKLRGAPPVSADINGQLHSQIIGMFLSRLT
ncbi:hypothetical protein AO066_18320 [Pseudomonas fluorescens]|nr:hypothetical protein AO066_18320 [Pseudomonas fluorescens]RMP88859.1 hypothetical protein ALQ17_00079 [Pseudomonas fluorescens]